MQLKKTVLLLVLILISTLVYAGTRPELTAAREHALLFYYIQLWGGIANAPSYADFYDRFIRVERKHPGYLDSVGQCALLPTRSEFWNCLDTLEWR